MKSKIKVDVVRGELIRNNFTSLDRLPYFILVICIELAIIDMYLYFNILFL